MVDNSDRQQIVNMADQDYTYTESLGLALYGDQTPADFRNGHNFNMRELDKDYGEIKDLAQTGVDASKKAQEDVKNVQDQLGGLGVDSVQDAQNLLARIEKTETNTNNNTAELKNKANVADVYNKTQSDERYELRSERSDVIWLGDSITAGSGATSAATKFVTLVNNFYGFKSHDFSKGGAGWIHAATGASNLATFPLQAQTAIEDDSYDHDSIAKIFILGGVNDFPTNNTEASNLYEAVRGTIKNLLSEFKNATVYVGAFLGGELSSTYSVANGFNRNRTVRCNIMNAALRATGGSRVVIADCFNWCEHDKNNYQSDMLHPNDYGHSIIAGKVRQMIEGGADINPNVAYIASDLAFEFAHSPSTSNTRVLRLSENAETVNFVVRGAHTIQESELSADKKTAACDIGHFGGWLRMVEGYDSCIIAGQTDRSGNGWYGGSYLILKQGDDKSIHIWAYVKNEAGLTAGSTLTMNCSGSFSTLGMGV